MDQPRVGFPEDLPLHRRQPHTVSQNHVGPHETQTLEIFDVALAYTLDDIEGQIKNRSKYASDYIYPDYVKIFADGGPFSATSLLLRHPFGVCPNCFLNARVKWL